MKNTVLAISTLFLTVSLGGCASMQKGSTAPAGVSVTRSHLGGEIARGEIRVEPANPERANNIEFFSAAAPVERELSRLGWTVARGNARSEQVALVRIGQASRGNGMVATELGVRIQRRSDATVAWEGRAELEARAGTALAAPAAAADRLAAAVFQGFPGESGRTIRVR